MPSQKITCTECDASLTVTEPVAPGKKIRCPKCQAIFRVPETAEEAIAEAPLARKGSRAAEPDDRDDDYDDDRPARRRPRSREQTGMGAGMVIGIIAASLLLLAAVGFAVWWGVSSWNESQIAAEQALNDALAAEAAAKAQQIQPPPNPLIPPKGANPLAAAGPQVGQTAPEIEAEDLDGQSFKLSDYRGKVVLLDFWGHW